MGLRLDSVLASAIADLYRLDLNTLLPAGNEVEVTNGRIVAGRARAAYANGDATTLLETYLRLIRRLRGQPSDEAVALRRVDIDHLARFLNEPGVAIVVRLGALMGATCTQRRAMATMFLAGALVVTVAAPVAALGGTQPAQLGGRYAALASESLSHGGDVWGRAESNHDAGVAVVGDTLGVGAVPTEVNAPVVQPVVVQPVVVQPLVVQPVVVQPVVVQPVVVQPAVAARVADDAQQSASTAAVSAEMPVPDKSDQPSQPTPAVAGEPTIATPVIVAVGEPRVPPATDEPLAPVAPADVG